MEQIIKFLEQLAQNNHRDWFEAHKAQYKQADAAFKELAERFVAGLGTFDPEVRGLPVKECTYRIYRDTRFSPDKTPYKTHMGAYVCKNGKKSGYAGYYLHLEPGRSILASGLHCPEPHVVRSVRDDIYARGDEFQKMIDNARKAEPRWELECDNALKKVPKGYPADFKYGDYLKLKDFCLIAPFDPAGNDALDRALAIFKQCKPFNDLLNRSVDYAHEEQQNRNELILP